ncbi:MAG TPA: radical SAM protein [Bacteroidales bacterium]|nr:radical SAM protein [Bacteroidales bacterium]
MHYNIPVFIPHLGCPFQCVFCNQKYISGKQKAPEADDVHSIIRQKLSTIDVQSATVEVAFFGGSFTCLDPGLQEKYLQLIQPYINDHKIKGIRLSTRPDYIDNKNLQLLKKYHVRTIELGVQSMSDSILQQAGRGHTVGDVVKASELIRNSGFTLGIQTMIGLPGDDAVENIHTASRVIGLKPDCVRIYPVLVLKDTELELLFSEGKYKPLSLSSAVDRVASVLGLYIRDNINVIKVGLHPAEDFGKGGKLLAGPFHPSFRELAMTKLWKNEFDQFIKTTKCQDTKTKKITLTVADSQYNYAIGYKAENKNYLKQYFNKVRFQRSENLNKLQFNVDYC